jgi:hypothetical protein
MIAALMLYMTIFSLLVAAAAWAIERALAAGSWPRRWLWPAAMVISLAGAAVLTFGRPSLPTASGAESVPAMAKSESRAVALRYLLIAAQAPGARQLVAPRGRISLEACAKWLWIGSSSLCLCLYGAGALRLRSARRTWSSRSWGNHRFFVAHDVGPAVFGLIRPAIVIPRWLLDEAGTTLETALLHEQAHITGRDPALLLAALLVTATAAWNLPLWWQLRRLKLAMEVDCDARVLRLGMDRRIYADVLLGINQHAGTMPLGAIAIVGRASQIEQRIRAMMSERPRHMKLWLAGWAAVAIPLLVGAAELNAPSPASAPAHVYLGIGLADLDVNGAAAAVTPVRHGAIVTYVNTGSVAEQAGLKRGDLILRFGNTSVTNARTLAAAVGHTAPDARVPLLIQRGTANRKLTADFSLSPPPHPSPAQIIDTSDWDSLRDSHLPITQPKLRDELVRLSKLDEMQAMLEQVSHGSPLPPDTSGIGAGPGMEPGRMQSNAHRLREIMAQYGWPTVSMVGVRGATAAGLIASGARDDPAFQAEVLRLMEPLFKRDEVPAMFYAALYDIVHTPQRFGSESTCENGENKPTKPLEDPQHLEERRATLGLPRMPKFCIVAGGAVNSRTP